MLFRLSIPFLEKKDRLAGLLLLLSVLTLATPEAVAKAPRCSSVYGGPTFSTQKPITYKQAFQVFEARLKPESAAELENLTAEYFEKFVDINKLRVPFQNQRHRELTLEEAPNLPFLSKAKWMDPLISYIEDLSEFGPQFYAKVNRALRAENTPAEMQDYISNFDRSLKKFPAFTGLSFRGTRLTPEQIAQYYPLGKPVVERAYLSTSLNPAIAIEFSKRIAAEEAAGKIPVIVMVGGKSGRLISFLSQNFAAEKEILFPRDSQFFVSESKTLNKGPFAKTHFILLQEI